MKKISGSALIFFLLILTGSSCKKQIIHYPFNMMGVWFAEGGFLSSGTVFEIQTGGQGKLFTYKETSAFSTGFDVNEKGTVKFKKDFLYVGRKKYLVVHEPQIVTDNDSIMAPDENDFQSGKTKMRRVLARMTITEKGFITFNNSYKFCKYVDY